MTPSHFPDVSKIPVNGNLYIQKSLYGLNESFGVFCRIEAFRRRHRVGTVYGGGEKHFELRALWPHTSEVGKSAGVMSILGYLYHFTWR